MTTTKPDGHVPRDSVGQEIWQRLTSARAILIATHANPDADAVASVLALRLALQEFVPLLSCATGDFTVPHTLRFLPGASSLASDAAELPTEVELVVLLDCADTKRLGPLYIARQQWFHGTVPIVNIDHHVTNTLFGDENLVDPTASSTTEVLTRWFLRLGIPITSDIATSLLTGLYGDTLSFQTSSTSASALELAALLLRHGARQEEIVENLFRRKPVSTILLWGAALSRVQVEPPIIWTEITPAILQTSGATAAEGEGIVNFLTGAEGTVVAILFYEQPEGWRVSLRSGDPLVDVAALCQHFGGGGHPRAAGCRLAPGEASRRTFLEFVKAAVTDRLRAAAPTG